LTSWATAQLTAPWTSAAANGRATAVGRTKSKRSLYTSAATV